MSGPVRACPVCPDCGSKRFVRIDNAARPDTGGRVHASDDRARRSGDTRDPIMLRCRSCGRILSLPAVG